MACHRLQGRLQSGSKLPHSKAANDRGARWRAQAFFSSCRIPLSHPKNDQARCEQRKFAIGRASLRRGKAASEDRRTPPMDRMPELFGDFRKESAVKNLCARIFFRWNYRVSRSLSHALIAFLKS
jgi:hypothetical protein